MEIEFDPAKDAANIEKHKISLSAAASLEVGAVIKDIRRSYGEDRFNAFGLIEGVLYCLSFTLRDRNLRAISLRRARPKEFRRYGL